MGVKLKKIFISTQSMDLGGVERSLIGLLDSIDYSKYVIDLFIHHHTGDLMEHINHNVNLLPEIPYYASLTKPIVKIAPTRFCKIALHRLIARLKHRNWIRRNHTDFDDYSMFHYVGNQLSPILPDISSKEYDLAISFLNPHNYVLDHVHAKKKWAWIHTDYSSVHVNIVLEQKIWDQYDQIIAISDQTKDAFITKFPFLTNKIEVIENILSKEYVTKLSKENNIQHLPNDILLCTVARFAYAKGIDRILEISNELKKSGINNFIWFVIGYGNDFDIKNLISKYGLEKHVILLGKLSNPYPYMKCCDIYIQPSRYEGKSVAIREALMLEKCVTISNFPTASSHIEDRVDGFIISNDSKKAAEELINIINNNKKRDNIIDNVRTRDYSNFQEIEKIYSYLNSTDYDT